MPIIDALVVSPGPHSFTHPNIGRLNNGASTLRDLRFTCLIIFRVFCVTNTVCNIAQCDVCSGSSANQFCATTVWTTKIDWLAWYPLI